MTPAEAAKKLRDMATRARNLGPPLRYFGEVVKDLMVESYAMQSSPGGDAWAPNKPSTIKRKRSSRAGMDTGRTRASLTVRVLPAIAEIQFGTNVPQAGPVFFGFTKAGNLRKRAPARDGHPARPAGAPFRMRVDGRSPLPVKAGKWDNRGRAATVLGRLGAIIREYVLTGRVTG